MSKMDENSTDSAMTGWVTQAEQAPQTVLAEVFWDGLDTAVTECGDLEDRMHLARVAGTLIRQLNDPAAVRTPANTLGTLLTREESVPLGEAVIRETVISELNAVLEAPEVSAAKLNALTPLVPLLIESGVTTDCASVQTDAVAVVLAIISCQNRHDSRITVGALRAVFGDDTVTAARESLPPAVTPQEAIPSAQ